mmetsp:Transcript_33733/g.77357  ORF Transcript_33733/g.77357 Transcript_33733/m.77357 type:complete len:205 (-) Transcript_33733:39-653(-)
MIRNVKTSMPKTEARMIRFAFPLLVMALINPLEVLKFPSSSRIPPFDLKIVCLWVCKSVMISDPISSASSACRRACSRTLLPSSNLSVAEDSRSRCSLEIPRPWAEAPMSCRRFASKSSARSRLTSSLYPFILGSSLFLTDGVVFSSISIDLTACSADSKDLEADTESNSAFSSEESRNPDTSPVKRVKSVSYSANISGRSMDS